MSLPIPTKELKLSVPWGHVAAKAWGNSEAKRVLVVHGYLDNADSFARIIPLLPRDWYYVGPDLPGHGLSSAFPSGVQLDFMNYVFAIRMILDALKWDNCVYIGHSFGAQLGVFMAILCPGRITRLVCFDALLPITPSGDEILQKFREVHTNTMIANASIEPPLYTKEEILYGMICKRYFALNTPAAEALFSRGTTKIGDLYKLNRDYRLRESIIPLLGPSQYTKLIRNLKIPVFLLVAKFSYFCVNYDHSYIEELKNVMANNCTIVHVSGNHDVHNNNPEIVAPHLCNFLNVTVKNKL